MARRLDPGARVAADQLALAAARLRKELALPEHKMSSAAREALEAYLGASSKPLAISPVAEDLAAVAWKVALKVHTWERGEPASKQVRDHIAKAVSLANQAQRELRGRTWTANEIDGAVEHLLTELQPPARGPRQSPQLLAKIAYAALSGGPADAEYRGVRGSVAQLLKRTQPKL